MGEVLVSARAMTRVEGAALREAVTASLLPHVSSARGISTQDAELAASWLVDAERLGLPSFGVEMLLRDLERLPASGNDTPSTESRPGAISAFDAAGLPGPLALAAVVRTAEQAVAEHGVAIVGVRGVGALGVLGLAARSLALTGSVALLAAHAPAWVAPWGGTRAAIGTNPIAFAAPRNTETGGQPLVADFATSELTLAELRTRQAQSTPLPEGTALDASGDPTTDAQEAAAILPQGRLGSLTGLLVEVLAGAATGGRPLATDASSPGRGAIVLAFDPSRSGSSHIAEACADIAREWRDAGGHLPSRFDALADEGLPDTLPLAADVAERIFAFAEVTQ